MKRALVKLKSRAASLELKAKEIFACMVEGNTVSLLEPQEQPPPLSDEANTDASVSDPPDVVAAKHYSEAFNRLSDAAVKASFNREIA